MRAFSTLLAVASLASSTLALPWFDKRNSYCMSDYDANQVANNFKTLIQNYSNATANAVLTSNYVDYTDSVIELINSGCSGPDTLGTATFKNRAAFEAGQGSQPSITFDILNIWHNCNSVTVRWRTPLTPQEVTGILVLEVTHNTKAGSKHPWLISTTFSEFNSGAWLVDLGTFKPTCSS